MTIRFMHHTGIIVEDLAAAKEFFVAIGLEVEGEMIVEGEWMAGVIDIPDPRANMIMFVTPDGHSRLEVSQFERPVDAAGPQPSRANALGIRHVCFNVSDLDEVLASVRALGYDTVGVVGEYEDVYRLCYVRGPEGIIIELAEDQNPETEGAGNGN